MAKAPAIQFYVKDWLSDPELKMASHSTKGIWIDMLCFMWESSERGLLRGTKDQLVRMLGATEIDFDLFIQEAKTLQFADVTICNKNVTVKNRRIYQEYKDKQNTRLRVKRYREKQKCNSDVTPSSPSPSPSPIKDKKPETEDFILPSFDDILFSSGPKVKSDLQKVCKALYDKKIFTNVHAFANTELKANTNPKAIIHALARCSISQPKEPWGYCKKIIAVENGNYNERDNT